MAKKFDIDEERLRDLYLIQDKSSTEIAKQFGVSKPTILNLLKQYSISKDRKAVEECRMRHQKQTCLERFGCENPAQSAEAKEKVKQTNLQKYGCECSLQNEDVKAKAKQTLLDRYGVEYCTQNQEVLDRRKETNLARYGCEHGVQNEEVKKKIRSSVMEHYGCEHAMRSEEVKEKFKQTNLAKYGCAAPMQNDEIKKKAKATNFAKFGYASFAQQHLSQETISIVSSAESLRDFVESNNITTTQQLSDRLGYSDTQVNKILHKLGLYDILDHRESNPEQEVRDFVESLGVATARDREILSGKEIDIYCPDYKIGIEFNGVYWHSTLYKTRDYHYKKSLDAEKSGVRIIHIYENEWMDGRTRPIIESLLRLTFGKAETKIYARKCEVREITNEEARPFVDANHIQGHRNAKVTVGLFYEGDLVQLMSFSHNKDYEWEIIRSCPKLNTSVVGGVSKLFAYFVNKYSPKEVFSYADFNKFDGHSYESLGMEFVGYTGPDMKWIIDGEVVNRNPGKNAEMRARAEAQIFGAGSKKFLWTAK